MSVATDYHVRALRVRAIDRMLSGELFDEAYKNSNYNSKQELDYFLLRDNEWAVRDWIKRHMPKDLRDMSFRKLRSLASLRNVPRYSLMSKDELVVALTKREAPRATSAQ